MTKEAVELLIEKGYTILKNGVPEEVDGDLWDYLNQLDEREEEIFELKEMLTWSDEALSQIKRVLTEHPLGRYYGRDVPLHVEDVLESIMNGQYKVGDIAVGDQFDLNHSYFFDGNPRQYTVADRLNILEKAFKLCPVEGYEGRKFVVCEVFVKLKN
ncbi:hypothetical protein [Sphingobacterium pedocola]|uniref:Uncharacterized protein n=1 Tax=Sphingobacterium pedocola TaxID=2082722 RepID=A0ABR9T6U7_9SPHI|nr:hypothetical protein [Sphingobacterium pedocola]MBE8720397.1 hypothetical protein [Sphingobacterium pedocola]